MVPSAHFACNYEMVAEGSQECPQQTLPLINSGDKLELDTEMASLGVDQNSYSLKFNTIAPTTDALKQTNAIGAEQLDQSLPHFFRGSKPTASEFDSDMSPDLIALKYGGNSASGKVLEFCCDETKGGVHAEDSADFTNSQTEVVHHVAQINKSRKCHHEESMLLKSPQVSEFSTLGASVEKPKSVSRRRPQSKWSRNQAAKKAQQSRPLKKSI